MIRRVNALIHGYSGAGKSRLLRTAPGPICVLDAEGGSKWLSGPDAMTEPWDPARPLPETNIDGSPIHQNTLVPIIVRDFDVLRRTLTVFQAGAHYFQSVEWDSITDIQARCKKGIRGMSDAMTQEMWGKLLDQMVDIVRAYRDLTDHPTNPVNVIVSALTAERGKNSVRLAPAVQGALADGTSAIPQYFDLVGYLYPELITSTDGKEQSIERRLLIQPYGEFVAKDRTDTLSQKYGLYIPNPNLTVMSAVLNEGLV